MIETQIESEVRKNTISIIYDRLEFLSMQHPKIPTGIEVIINFPTQALIKLAEQTTNCTRYYDSVRFVPDESKKYCDGSLTRFEGYNLQFFRSTKSGPSDSVKVKLVFDPQTNKPFILTESFSIQGNTSSYEIELSTEEFSKMINQYYNNEDL